MAEPHPKKMAIKTFLIWPLVLLIMVIRKWCEPSPKFPTSLQ